MASGGGKRIRINTLQIPRKAIHALEKTGIEALFPPQQKAVEKGVLDGKNIVLAVPTAAGKTLVAELAMLKSILEKNGKAIYIVPLRALASEKYEEFSEKYEPLDIKVAISTGDYDASDPHLGRYDIIIATSEKTDSLIRHRAGWMNNLSVVVADEIHLINDASRGPTLETTLAQLRQINPDAQIVALSATIKNAIEIADWLGAELVESDWRPVDLREGVYSRGIIHFDNGETREIAGRDIDATVNLALDTVKEGGQALIFVNRRRSTESLAIKIAKHLPTYLSKEEKTKLKQAAEEALGALTEPTRICKKLARAIVKGVAFHHAGLHYRQRKVIENSFRETFLKVVTATPTLAMGVDMPARKVVVRDHRRYERGYGLAHIPVLEYKQMCGRAGRPKYDDLGEALLVAKNPRELDFLLDTYVWGEPERITSKLASEAALRAHILAAIATGYVATERDLDDFIGWTFFAYQYDPWNIAGIVDSVLDFLEKEGMVNFENGQIRATKFGGRVSQLYIDPLSAVYFRDALKKGEEERGGATPFALLHSVCRAPDIRHLYLRKKDYDRIAGLVERKESEFLFPAPDRWKNFEEYEWFLAEVKTAEFLSDWIDETVEDEMVEKYGLGPGDIRVKIERSVWLLYAMLELAKLFQARKIRGEIAKLLRRVRYGVREELLELVGLRGVGRVRARKLFVAGYKTLGDLEKAAVRDLARVRYVGVETAKKIKQQLS